MTFSLSLDILSDLEQDFVSCLLSYESNIAVGNVVGLTDTSCYRESGNDFGLPVLNIRL